MAASTDALGVHPGSQGASGDPPTQPFASLHHRGDLLTFHSIPFIQRFLHSISNLTEHMKVVLSPFLVWRGSFALSMVAVSSTVALQLAIWASGNYAIFNLLTIVLCLPVLDFTAASSPSYHILQLLSSSSSSSSSSSIFTVLSPQQLSLSFLFNALYCLIAITYAIIYLVGAILYSPWSR